MERTLLWPSWSSVRLSGGMLGSPPSLCAPSFPGGDHAWCLHHFPGKEGTPGISRHLRARTTRGTQQGVLSAVCRPVGLGPRT